MYDDMLTRLKLACGGNLTFSANLGGIVLIMVLFIILNGSVSAGQGLSRLRELSGRVEKVIDGDSLILRQGKRDYEIRLWGIDCPEYGQPYGDFARKMSRIILGRQNVRVVVKGRDGYGRHVGIVYLEGLNVNEELVRNGAAWVYGQYCREAICDEWKSLEMSARNDRRGLWKEKSQVAPWKWRRSN